MYLEGRGEVLTPVEDLCEYDVAWRFSLASYLFSIGMRSKDDFICLRDNGGIMIVTQEQPTKAERHKIRKGKKIQGKTKEPAVKKVMRPVVPFSEHSEYRSLASDEWVQKMVFMMNEEVAGQPLSEDFRPIKMAMRWYEQDDSEAAMKKRLEPLLLTDVSLDVIMLDLLGSLQHKSSIKAYERLFFCSRDDDFNLHPSIQRIQQLAMPWGTLNFGSGERKNAGTSVAEDDGRPRAKASDWWRVVAADLGYDALITIWGWNAKAHGLKDKSLRDSPVISTAVIAILVNNTLESLCVGTIGHKDAAKMVSTYTTLLKLMEPKSKDKKIEELKKSEEELLKAFLGVLQKTAPKMVLPDEGSIDKKNKEIQDRIDAQLAISNQPIEDVGEQVGRDVTNEYIWDKINE